MLFQRKVYDRLLEWKNHHAPRYAVLLEGARRVGKSTIAQHFAKNEYRSYVMIDFSNTSSDVIACFDDLHDLDMFFLRLQALTGITLYPRESVIVFDEIQFFPRARQAIKHLVADGRYHYIETGSLISIQKNVKDILIPSEEMRLPVYPMDYEEFQNAIESNGYDLAQTLFHEGKPAGIVHRKWMRDYRVYMAVGGMPQAVAAYVEGRNFSEIDTVKREIIRLYQDDFRKIDSSGFLSSLYQAIPAQLSSGRKRYVMSKATGKRKGTKDFAYLQELIASKTVLISYNTTDPRVSLSLTKSRESFKLYLADTGLFVTLMLMDRPEVSNEIYAKLLSDKLPANLGYLYENAVAQAIASSGRELYYHTWNKKDSTHYYEVDFLISEGSKVNVLEIKSSGIGQFDSLREFKRKYSKTVGETIVLSTKDRKKEGEIRYLPIYDIDYIL